MKSKGQHLGMFIREVTHEKWDGTKRVTISEGNFQINVTVDVEGLVNALGPRAARSKAGVAREASGLVVVRAKRLPVPVDHQDERPSERAMRRMKTIRDMGIA